MLDLLWLVFIAPIEFCMQAVFDGGYALTHSYGLALIGVSLVVNTAVLPIYNKAEEWQEEERALKKRMEPEEQMIRRCFRGQERFAMLSTWYRQCGYSPLMTLRASIGLLLQIPFFLAAYLLLSNMVVLDGVSFGPIRNLGAPDGLLSIGGVHINVLPILMTAINLFSAFFYTHGLTRRDKVQVYGMAAIFLVLLYNSPAGLTFYWTLNNIYSLCKNIVQKDWMKRPGWAEAKQRLSGVLERRLASLWTRALGIETPVFVLLGIIGVAALAMLGYGIVKHAVPSLAMSAFLFAALAVLGILGRSRFPLARRLPAGESFAVLAGALGLPYMLARYGLRDPSVPKLILGLLLVGGVMWALTLGKSVLKRACAYMLPQRQDLARLFLPAGALMAFLVCVYFPFLVFSSEPVVFGLNLEDFAANRLGIFFVAVLCLAVVYALGGGLRWLLGSVSIVLALAALAFCFIVSPDVGAMDAFVLQRPEALERWYNGIIDAAVFVTVISLFLVSVYFRKVKILATIVYAAMALLVVGAGINFLSAKDVIASLEKPEAKTDIIAEVPNEIKEYFTFSKNGKNIIVVMLDMFTGGNMNQLLERHPDLRTELDGFIWYEDVVTAGSLTIFGKPGILGGVDAHPLVLNEDTSKSLEEKVSSAYGKLFRWLQEKNFRISGFDAEFFVPDLLRAQLPKPEMTHFIKAPPKLMWARALEVWEEKHRYEKGKSQNFQRFFDMVGCYNVAPLWYKSKIYNKGNWRNTIQLNNFGIQHASTQLANLEVPLYASTVSSADVNSFIYITSLLTHVPWAVDEKGMPSAHGGWNESRNLENSGLSEEHLRAEYFALKKLIEWFAWMKKNHVYDNTQIILVSDHGRGDSAKLVKMWGQLTGVNAHGLLLVKEYDAHGPLVIDRNSQMTNWDVPALIKNALSEDSGKEYPWRDTSRVRMHTSGRWRRSDHDKNFFTLHTIVKIQGPLYSKDSWTKVKGGWPPDK